MWFWQKWKINKLEKKAKREQERRDQGQQDTIQNEIRVYLELAKLYQKNAFNKRLPHAKDLAFEYYRQAANLGSADAQYYFGHEKLEQGKFWNDLAKSWLGRSIHTTYANASFEEAFNYLNEAKAVSHVQAIRTLGLAYIHGWGVPADKEKGFKFIVDSVDLEQGWDKAPELFKKLGLNNSEFFSAMMSLKNKK